MKPFLLVSLLALCGLVYGQDQEVAPKWNFQANLYLQNALIETTVGSNKVLRSTNVGTQSHIGRSISKAYAIYLSTSAEDNWVLDGHTFASTTVGFGISTGSLHYNQSEGVTLSPVLWGVSGYYRFLSRFKAPDGETALKPDNGVFGVGGHLGFTVNAGRVFFGPILNVALDFKDFKFTNGETLKFKESAGIGFGFGFRF